MQTLRERLQRAGVNTRARARLLSSAQVEGALRVVVKSGVDRGTDSCRRSAAMVFPAGREAPGTVTPEVKVPLALR